MNMTSKTCVKIIVLFALIMIALNGNSQQQTSDSVKVIKFDDTRISKWSKDFQVVDIKSTKDDKIQKAIVYKSKKDTKQPLIVSLHTWSGDYTQKDPLANEVLAKDWNYIHSNFRGPNRNPEAMGSEFVLSDIADAIDYALKYTNADPNEVHIVGVSGGGYATLASYMNIQYPVKSFSAWAPISDIESWYWESVGRKQKYANDILMSLSSDNTFNAYEAKKRSPIFQNYPKQLRKKSRLYIYEGVHDGYTGSVPITHSINMYNRLVGDLKSNISDLDSIMTMYKQDPDLVSNKEIIDLLTKRCNPACNKKEEILNRQIHLQRTYKNIKLVIFEGGHEQIPGALELIPVN